MRMCWPLALFVSLFMMLVSRGSIAATPDDFVCKELAMLNPDTPTYNMQFVPWAVTGCSPSGKPSKMAGVCIMSVYCAYAPKAVKKAAAGGKDFASLTGIEKRIAMDSIKAQWLPTTLTCEGPGPTECPPPENCKGDLFYNPQPARIAQAAVKEMSDRLLVPGTNQVDPNKEKAFQHVEGFESDAVESAP